MCSVSMSPTFSSPTFFASLKSADGSARACRTFAVSTLGGFAVEPVTPPAAPASADGSSTYQLLSYWSHVLEPSDSTLPCSARAPRVRARSTSDAFLSLSVTPFTFSEIGCDSSAPAAPAPDGVPSSLTFSARSSFAGPVCCLMPENSEASAPADALEPLAAGAVVADFLSLPPQPAATRAGGQLARISGRRISGRLLSGGCTPDL